MTAVRAEPVPDIQIHESVFGILEAHSALRKFRIGDIAA